MQALTFGRPAYLEVLAVVLVLLIAISAALALFTRSVNELALGVGGLILGVWGIRSVLMPTSIPTVTAIDLALSWIILLLLLGFALRAPPLPSPQRPAAATLAAQTLTARPRSHRGDAPSPQTR